MMGTSVYFRGYILYASPTKMSRGKGMLMGSHPPSNENSILFL
jgi:hypothetical protein